MLPPIDELNALADPACRMAMAPMFENAPAFVARLAGGRPYGSYGELLRRAEELALSLREAEQVALINGHPPIGAGPADVSPMSRREQGYDRPAAAGEVEVQRALDRLNEAYEQRFGFRFVIFVAGRPRSAIVPLMEEGLRREREEELQRALSDVFAIARDRLLRLTPSEESA